MKRLLIAALLAVLAAPAAAQLYKWVDKDGKTHYSDAPPPNQETKQLNVQSGATTNAPAKSSVERDKAAQKARDEAKESGKKADEAARNASDKDESCSRAKQAYATYADGGRIHKYNDKGEREFLSDEAIEKERERSRREMDEACKK